MCRLQHIQENVFEEVADCVFGGTRQVCPKRSTMPLGMSDLLYSRQVENV